MMKSNLQRIEENDLEDVVYDDYELAEKSTEIPLEGTQSDTRQGNNNHVDTQPELTETPEAPEPSVSEPEIPDTQSSEPDQEDIVTDDEELSPTEILDKLIDELPDNFPSALPIIREQVVPIMRNLTGGVYDHYVQLLKTRTKASTKKAVHLEIQDEIMRMEMKEKVMEVMSTVPTAPDPEVLVRVEEIKQDPLSFRKRMDLVGALGIVGERRAIGVHFITLDSRLIPKDGRKSEALAEKCSGPHGTGKSFPLLTCLSIYPESAYHLITNASSKSLYSIENGLKHKALVLVEALALEKSFNGDNELAYSIRTLVSEGDLIYQYTGYEDKVRKTIKVKVPGPTALLTTTVQGRLETQLEDRMITVHPDISNAQTRSILEVSTRKASGELVPVNEKEIESWKIFHKSLAPADVVIPFAGGIVRHLKEMRDLPTAIHRAFGRVISAIKSVAIFYQYQRERDESGRIIADMSDYAIARQLINEPFMESIGLRNSYTERRVQVIKQKGPISMKDFAVIEKVSVPTLTPWVKERVEKGILVWCDGAGQSFPDSAALEKAKRSGKAFIRVGNAGELPTPFELTRDEKWKKGGELFELYDLGIDSEIVFVEELDVQTEHSDGVRALGQIDDEEENAVDEKEPKIVTPPPTFISEDIDLEKEFKDVLTFKGPRKSSEVPNGVLLI